MKPEIKLSKLGDQWNPGVWISNADIAELTKHYVPDKGSQHRLYSDLRQACSRSVAMADEANEGMRKDRGGLTPEQEHAMFDNND